MKRISLLILAALCASSDIVLAHKTLDPTVETQANVDASEEIQAD